MTVEDTLRVVFSGAAMHLAKTCILQEEGTSSGTVVYELREYVPDPLQLYQLQNGVLLDLKTQAVQNLYAEDVDWQKRYTYDNSFNTQLFISDFQIVETCCNWLRNNGLNALLKSIREAEATKDFTDTIPMALFIVTLVLYNNFGHYSESLLNKLRDILGKLPIAGAKIQEMATFLQRNTKTVPDMLSLVAKTLLSWGFFEMPDESWVNFTSNLIYLGAAVNLEECRKNKWTEAVKVQVVCQYLLKMIDRKVFSSIYDTGNTHSYYCGFCLNNNNYTGDYNCTTFPAYKLHLSDCSTALLNIEKYSTIYVRGLNETEYAADLQDITTYTGKEMLKSGVVSDGSDCVVFQMILRDSNG